MKRAESSHASDLVVGPWRVQLENGGLRRMFWNGHEVVRRCYFSVRDDAWGDVPQRIVRQEVEHTGARAVVLLAGEAVGEGIAIDWQARIELHPTGAEFTVRPSARQPGQAARIGVCLLPPPASDESWRATVDSVTGQTDLGDGALILPQTVIEGFDVPPMDDIVSLRVETAAWSSTWLFRGEQFGMEDQRNWTDASYKIFAGRTPATPESVPAGDLPIQSASLALEGRPAETAPPIDLDGAVPARLPALGWTLPSDAPVVDPGISRRSVIRADADAAAVLRLLHEGVDVAVEVTASTASLLTPEILTAARRVVVVAEDGPPAREQAASARALLAQGLRATGVGTDADFVWVSSATSTENVEGALAWRADPRVHAQDARSVMETPSVHGDQVRTAKARFGDAPMVVAVADPAAGEHPEAEEFRTAWTLASIVSLTAAGAEEVFYTVEGETARIGALLRALTELGERADVALPRVGDPLEWAALAYRGAEGTTLLLANLSADARRISLPGAFVPVPAGFADEARSEAAAGRTDIEFDGYGVAVLTTP